jgi:hypothetical protein
MRIYFDEMGDLGFDFGRGASNYFCIAAFVLHDNALLKFMEKAVAITMRRKMHIKKKNVVNELKGTTTEIAVKKYLWQHIADKPLEIHAIVFDKQKVHPDMQRQRNRIYNYLAHLVVEKIDFKLGTDHLYVQIDRSKGKHGREEFNRELSDQIQAKVPLNVPLTIEHPLSERSKGVQLADVFGWGVYRKYEQKDTEWYDIFKEKLVTEQLFVPPLEWRN